VIESAVIPVAGFGTRLLPATKSQPKEMLPVARKPIVQYVVEELVSNGVQQILFVTGRNKRPSRIISTTTQNWSGRWRKGKRKTS
jgi:UTP--glucose-1-phosphate uridylyltransferase